MMLLTPRLTDHNRKQFKSKFKKPPRKKSKPLAFTKDGGSSHAYDDTYENDPATSLRVPDWWGLRFLPPHSEGLFVDDNVRLLAPEDSAYKYLVRAINQGVTD